MTDSVYLHPHPGCAIYNFWSKYLTNLLDPSAVYLLPTTNYQPTTNFNPTARNRHNYALKLGYHAQELTWPERNQYLEDIYAINTSTPIRQKRLMKANYLEKPVPFTTPDPCKTHFSTFLGCFKPGNTTQKHTLVAYIITNFCGNLAAASQILGHAAFLNAGIMPLLWAKFIEICTQRGITHIIYSRWADGHDGLRHWKHSVGLQPIVLTEKLL